MDPQAVLAERDRVARLVLMVVAENRRLIEVYDLKHLAVWTANAFHGKAP